MICAPESSDVANRAARPSREEIFAASQDEALQIAHANPQIGQYLGAPCTLRYAGKARPICPEGDRYCGVPVWKLQIKDYVRVL